MATWTSDELTKIGKAEELEIGSLRRDGTRRDPVTIWVVRLGDELYVRAVKGAAARGFAARRRARPAAFGRAAWRKTWPLPTPTPA